MYGRIYDSGMGTYPPRDALALCTSPSQSAVGRWGWGFHTIRGGFDPGVSTTCGPVSTRGKSVFVPGLSELYMYGRIYDPGMGTYPPRDALALCTSPNQSAVGRWGWGFHTMWGGFDPGDRRFRPRVVGVVKVWKHL